jgi:hypothetical protein
VLLIDPLLHVVEQARRLGLQSGQRRHVVGGVGGFAGGQQGVAPPDFCLHLLFVEPLVQVSGVLVGTLGSGGIVVEDAVDLIGVGAGLILDPFGLVVPMVFVALLARAKAQAQAIPAKGELNGSLVFLVELLLAKLPRYFHMLL